MDDTLISVEDLCRRIVGDPAIRRRIVLLCEGDRPMVDDDRPPSPQTRRGRKQLPDADFYDACLPRSWRNLRPRFFTCGGRSDVLKAYATLLEMHSGDPINSALSPDKLFAIVDCDFSPQTIENYHFPNVDEIFHSLYDRLEVRPENLINHRIFVTGLVHKENYFLIPELQPIFDAYHAPPQYRSPKKPVTPLDLSGLYQQMAQDLCHDNDLAQHWQRAHPRVAHCTVCNDADPQTFSQDWLTAFKSTTDSMEKAALAHILLTLRKAKEYWRDAIVPPSDWPPEAEATYKDELKFAIGQFYSEHSNDPRFHISFLLSHLQQYV
jgi:hypothetical protein